MAGLHTGSAVQFNGVRVGEVTQLALDAHDPRKIEALIAVDRVVQVRADTTVTLEFQGLTGLAGVSLTGDRRMLRRWSPTTVSRLPSTPILMPAPT